MSGWRTKKNRGLLSKTARFSICCAISDKGQVLLSAYMCTVVVVVVRPLLSPWTVFVGMCGRVCVCVCVYVMLPIGPVVYPSELSMHVG